MKVVLGAPVAERAWILPSWWGCLTKQTLQPAEYRFVRSLGQDETGWLLSWPGMGRSIVYVTTLPYHSRNERNDDRNDPWRAKHMADLRNQLRKLFLATDADVFVSLDTDILLEDPTTLERLVQTLQDGWDVATLTTYLHPLGPRSECYNVGFFTDRSEGLTQGWRRAELRDATSGESPVGIDIPMAVFAITREALSVCEYRAHGQGEDVGFAQDLAKHNCRVAWCTDLEGHHIWDEQALQREVLRT